MMSEPMTVTDERAENGLDVHGVDVHGVDPRVAGVPAPEDLVSVDMLLEDVSIDGLCGVY